MNKGRSDKRPEESHKQTLKKLRDENRRLQKNNKILRREIEELKNLKPDQVTRAKKREEEKILRLCRVCNEGNLEEMSLPFGKLITCTNCDYRKVENR